MSAPARGSCSADVGYDDYHHCHTLFRILENDDCFRRQGPDAAGCFLGGKALRLPSLPPFAGFFFFFLALLQPSLGGFPGQRSSRQQLP